MAVAVAIAAWQAVASEHDGAAGPLLALGLAGAGCVVLALAWPSWLAPGLCLLGGAYALRLVIDEPPLDAGAALLAAALVVVARLAAWSVELRTTGPDEPGGAARTVPWIAIQAVAALAATGTVLALVDVIGASGLALEGVGVAAALAATALVALAARGDAPRNGA